MYKKMGQIEMPHFFCAFGKAKSSINGKDE